MKLSFRSYAKYSLILRSAALIQMSIKFWGWDQKGPLLKRHPIVFLGFFPFSHSVDINRLGREAAEDLNANQSAMRMITEQFPSRALFTIILTCAVCTPSDRFMYKVNAAPPKDHLQQRDETVWRWIRGGGSLFRLKNRIDRAENQRGQRDWVIVSII